MPALNKILNVESIFNEKVELMRGCLWTSEVKFFSFVARQHIYWLQVDNFIFHYFCIFVFTYFFSKSSCLCLMC